MTVCPAGHDSANDDFCDVCGTRIGGNPASSPGRMIGRHHGPGRARRTTAKPVQAVERRYSVSSATRAVSVPGPAGRLPPWAGRPNLSRPPRRRPGRRRRRSRARPRIAVPADLQARAAVLAPGPDGAATVLVRSPGPCTDPYSRRSPEPRAVLALRPVAACTVLVGAPRPPDPLAADPDEPGSPAALPGQPAHPTEHRPIHRRTPCVTRPPAPSPEPLRPLLRSVRNRHSHSWLPSSRRPRLKSGLNQRPRPGSGPSHALRSFRAARIRGSAGSSAPPTAPTPSFTPATWTVLIASDRAYYDRMKAVRGMSGSDVAFPAHTSERRIPLIGKQMRIGRRSAARELEPEIDLADPPVDPGISRLHAMLIASPDGTWSILDPGSANGTLLNGREIATGDLITLREGDRINLGAWTVISVHRG